MNKRLAAQWVLLKLGLTLGLELMMSTTEMHKTQKTLPGSSQPPLQQRPKAKKEAPTAGPPWCQRWCSKLLVDRMWKMTARRH